VSDTGKASTRLNSGRYIRTKVSDLSNINNSSLPFLTET
jgi:hypothetical protein